MTRNYEAELDALWVGHDNLPGVEGRCGFVALQPGRGSWDTPNGYSMVRFGATVTVLDEMVVNNSGQVAGSSARASGGRAFPWDPLTGTREGQVTGTSMTPEDVVAMWDADTGTTLVGPRGWNAVAISDRGQVAGTGPTGAWRWDPVTGIVDDLGDAHEVADINDEGQVVGTSFIAGHYQAWLCDPVTGRVNLSAPDEQP